MSAINTSFLSDKWKFYDHGFVPSVRKFTKTLCDRYRFYGVKSNDSRGRYLIFENDVHVFYEQQSSVSRNIRVRAHEFLHAADVMGALGDVEKVILKDTGVDLYFGGIGDAEVRAELGAVYALDRRRYPLEVVEYRFHSPKFQKALKIYKNSKVR